MKLMLLLLSCLLASGIRAASEPMPTGAPIYFAKWSMVKMWPKPQEPLDEDTIAKIKRREIPNGAYTVVYYNEAGKLWTIEEIVAGRRKIKFAYVYDAGGKVTRIEMFFPDGQTKTYFRADGKLPEKPGAR